MASDEVANEQGAKKKSSCCAKCCKCFCCCCCCCLLLLVIAGIVVFNTVLKVDAQTPPAPAAPTSDVTLGVSYSGSDPNSDATFKSSLVSNVLGALPGNLSDASGEIADSLVFGSSRRLGAADAAARELASGSWTVVMPLAGEAAVSAADVFTSSSFSPSSIANVLSVSVSSDMTVLAMGHLLKDLNFVCKGVISKALDEYRAEIIGSLEKENVTGATLGISEEGWVWASFRKSGWKYSATALGCEATLAWEEAIKVVLEQDLGACTLSGEGIKAVVGSGKSGDTCYIDSIKNLLSETALEQCPAAGDSMCSSQSSVCEDFQYPGCSSCPTPASMKYLPCTPFN